MAVVFVLGAVAAILVLFWRYFSRDFQYWTSRGVVSCNAFSLTGDRGGGLPFGKPFFEILDPIYHKYKGKERFVGTFQASQPILVPMDPEIIKYILTKDFSNFHSRGQPRSPDDPFSNSLFFLDGPQWKNLRVKLSPTFTSGKLKMMFPIMADVTKQLNACVRKFAAEDSNREVEIQNLLLRYSTDVIGTVAFGIDCNTLAGENDEFLMMSQDITRNSFLFMLRFFLVCLHPIFSKLIPFKYMFKKSTIFFTTLMKDTVEYREKNNVERSDFVHLLMKVRDEDRNRTIEDRVNHIEFTHDNMAGQAFLFFLAGLDNIANTVGFSLHELALNPDLQDRAVEEIRAKIEKYDGKLSYEALKDMDLLERIANEALRKYTPVAILTRKPSGPIQLPDSDVVIDTKTVIWIPVWQMMRDPDFYPDPERFDPDRFTEEAKEDRHSYTYLPFGEGPRFCIAERFAILEIKLCLASLLVQHKFSVGKKTQVPIEFDATVGAPRPKKGFWLQVDDRE